MTESLEQIVDFTLSVDFNQPSCIQLRPQASATPVGSYSMTFQASSYNDASEILEQEISITISDNVPTPEEKIHEPQEAKESQIYVYELKSPELTIV